LLAAEGVELKAPKSKLQAPKKLQTSRLK